MLGYLVVSGLIDYFSEFLSQVGIASAALPKSH